MNLKNVILRLLFVKFETCKIASFSQSELIDKTIGLLNKEHYTIINSSDEEVTFRSNTFEKNSFRSFGEASKKISYGILKLQKTENAITIKLTSLRSIFTEIFFLLLIVIIALFTSYWILFLLLFVLLRFSIWSNNNKRVTLKLISDIIQQTN